MSFNFLSGWIELLFNKGRIIGIEEMVRQLQGMRKLHPENNEEFGKEVKKFLAEYERPLEFKNGVSGSIFLEGKMEGRLDVIQILDRMLELDPEKDEFFGQFLRSHLQKIQALGLNGENLKRFLIWWEN